MLELGSSEDFHSLRKCGGAQDSGQQDYVYDLFPHRILSSETANLSNYFGLLRARSRAETKLLVPSWGLSRVTGAPSTRENCDCVAGVNRLSDNVESVKHFLNTLPR